MLVIIKRTDAFLIAARASLCAPSLPILVLSDLFELLPLASCRQLFSCVEANTPTWKEELFFVPVRNYLLRICNGKASCHILLRSN
jgi:hypothetical protein